MPALAHQTLSQGQIQQLQWVLPTPFSPELTSFFRTRAAIGAKLRFTAKGTEHWLGVFELERMVDEVLRCPNAALARFPRLLPFAGCGRRRTTIYLVDVSDSTVWLLDGGNEPVCLGVSLEQLWSSAQVEPRVSVRRRLPPRQTLPRVARSIAKTTRQRTEPACERTLALFPGQV